MSMIDQIKVVSRKIRIKLWIKTGGLEKINKNKIIRNGYKNNKTDIK